MWKPEFVIIYFDQRHKTFRQQHQQAKKTIPKQPKDAFNNFAHS
jgi:hypothetical protein